MRMPLTSPSRQTWSMQQLVYHCAAKANPKAAQQAAQEAAQTAVQAAAISGAILEAIWIPWARE